jgi:hypothetical protein
MTFYEQVGIVIPGSVFLVGLLFYFPALNALMVKDGVTLGQFGIFLLLSFLLVRPARQGFKCSGRATRQRSYPRPGPPVPRGRNPTSVCFVHS